MKRFLVGSAVFFAMMSSAFAAQVLSAEQQLNKGQYLSTQSGLFSLVMQNDGNVVRYFTAPFNPARVGYGSGGFTTNTSNGAYLRMQIDGNLVLYTGSGTWAWTSGTGGQPFDPEFKLVLRETGAIEIWRGGNLWRTVAGPDHTNRWDQGTARFPFKKVVGGVCTDGFTDYMISGTEAMTWASTNGGVIGYCNSPY